MLRRAARWFVVGALGAVVGAVLGVGPAFADGHVYCSPDGDCYWIVDNPGNSGNPGNPGNPGNGGGSGVCKDHNGTPLPCVVDGLGVWDGGYCYIKRVDPPPGERTDGYWTVGTCSDGNRQWTTPPTWSATPPAGILPSYAELAQRAVAEMHLDGPQIGIAPTPNGAGLVGLPVWLWTTVTPIAGDGPKTWGTVTRTASVPGRSVTATARSTKIVWSLGDGSPLITCTGPGAAYQPSFGLAKPECGSATGYQHPSKTVSGGRFKVTGTTTWEVTWSGAGGGPTGNLTFNLSTTATIEIQELQVVTS